MKSPTIKVYVWTDFVCPFCLLGEGKIKQAIEGLNAELVWMPFELRPYPADTLRPEDDYLPRVWKASVYPAAKQLGVDIQLPTVSPQPYTRAAFIGMQFAAEQGLRAPYVEAVIRAFFQQDRDVGDISVLKQVAEDVGMNGEAFVHSLSEQRYAELHEKALAQAKVIGIRAVPTLLVGEQLMSGMQDVATLRAEVLKATTNLLD